tara:strand:+ start:2327 stop:2905 length:579 start_codon:yes stop_codon:yes gene_type:complete
MSFLPVGRRRQMQSQIFKTADDEFNSPDLDSNYMSGENIPMDFSNDGNNVDQDLGGVDVVDLKSSIFSELENIGLPSRVAREKQDSIFGQTLKSDGTLSGFFLIPTFTAEGKVSLNTATGIAKDVSSRFSLDWQIEEINNNYRVKFETKKQEASPESSFDQLGKKASVNDNVFSELLEERKNLLYKKLRDIK